MPAAPAGGRRTGRSPTPSAATGRFFPGERLDRLAKLARLVGTRAPSEAVLDQRPSARTAPRTRRGGAAARTAQCRSPRERPAPGSCRREPRTRARSSGHGRSGSPARPGTGARPPLYARAAPTCPRPSARRAACGQDPPRAGSRGRARRSAIAPPEAPACRAGGAARGRSPLPRQIERTGIRSAMACARSTARRGLPSVWPGSAERSAGTALPNSSRTP